MSKKNLSKTHKLLSELQMVDQTNELFEEQNQAQQEVNRWLEKNEMLWQ